MQQRKTTTETMYAQFLKVKLLQSPAEAQGNDVQIFSMNYEVK
jgi:hypothetical protein